MNAQQSMQAAYARCLENAHNQSIVIFHADPKVGEWFVQNPAHEGYYIVRLVDEPRPHFTCNCEAGQREAYCKHRAIVREAVINKTELPRLLAGKLAVALARVMRGMPATEPEPPTTPPTAPAPTTPTANGYGDIRFECRGCHNQFAVDDLVLEGSLLNPYVRCKPCHAEHKASLKSAKAAEKAAKAQPAVQVVKPVCDGKWTLQFPDGSHRTFKIHTQPADASFAPGERVVKYLAHADNMDERSYVGFAFLKADRLVIWSRFRSDSQLAEQAQYLLNPEAAAEAGKAYALASNCCYRCGHDLTDPTSVKAGLGPDCRAALGF